MIVSFKNKFVFVAIPKTATHAVRRALRPHLTFNDWEQCGLFETKSFPVQALANLGHGHITYEQIRPVLLPGMWSQFFSFCFVRNPYDRFLSACHFVRRDDQSMRQNPLDTMKCIIEKQKTQEHIMFRPQYEFVTTISGQPIVDKIGKYESLQDDYDHVCERIGIASTTLSRVNQSKHRPRVDCFDSELKEMIYSFYRKDFLLFGYAEDITAS